MRRKHLQARVGARRWVRVLGLKVQAATVAESSRGTDRPKDRWDTGFTVFLLLFFDFFFHTPQLPAMVWCSVSRTGDQHSDISPFHLSKHRKESHLREPSSVFHLKPSFRCVWWVDKLNKNAYFSEKCSSLELVTWDQFS